LPSLYADTPGRFQLGTEFTFWGAVKPRFGLAQNMSSTDLNRWLTAGLGIELKPTFMGPIQVFNFGYSHLFHDIDGSPRVGLTLGW
jgi:hypothetical protein